MSKHVELERGPDPWFTPAAQQAGGNHISGTFGQWERTPLPLDPTNVPGWAAAAHARLRGDGCTGETCSEDKHKAEHSPEARRARTAAAMERARQAANARAAERASSNGHQATAVDGNRDTAGDTE